MAENAADDLSYYLEINKQHRDYLAELRSWSNLKIAADEDTLWIKDFTYSQITSNEVKSIPYKSLYYAKENRLFPLDGLLPLKKVPGAVLWSPVEKGIPVELPDYNHNYFGMDQKLGLKLIESGEEHNPAALLTDYLSAEKFILASSAIRLKNLSWVIIENKVLILGIPLLPIPGNTYWMHNSLLLPAGYEFEFPVLSDSLEKKINPENDNLVVFNKDCRYFNVPRNILKPLSTSSFRLSKRLIKA